MIDLEHFPTSQTAQRMVARVSPIYEKSYVGKWLYQVMGEEMDDAWLRFEEIRLQAFPETATWGLPYWEQRYGVTPTPSQTLEERRRAVIAKRNTRAPMNPARIELILGNMTGKVVACIENVGPYTFSVTIYDAKGDMNIESAVKKLQQIKPSHQTFELAGQAPEQRSSLYLASTGMTTSRRELPELELERDLNDRIYTGVAMAWQSSRWQGREIPK